MEKKLKRAKRKLGDVVLGDGTKLRDLYAPICKEEKYFGKIDTRFHTDILHLINGYAKKRPKISLSADRLLALDTTLKQAVNSPVQNVEELRKLVLKIKEERLRNFNAAKHYDKERTVAYTVSNQIPQRRLTHRCVELLPAAQNESGLLLDIGCGSGLSTKFAKERVDCKTAFAIGLDRSPDMLLQCDKSLMDTVLIDMGQRLPFREAVFDGCISVSAIHFLFGPKDEKVRGKRLMSSLSRCLVHSSGTYRFAAQFFPETPQVPTLLLNSAKENGFKGAQLLIDYTHHTAAFRWYIHCFSDESEGGNKPARFCILAEEEEGVKRILPGIAGSTPHLQCCLCIHKDDERLLNKDHHRWMITDHVRRARQLIRKFNFDPNIISSERMKTLAETLRDTFGAKVSQQEILERYEVLDIILHPQLK